MLTYEFPTLLAFCNRIQERAFADPLQVSPRTRPFLSDVLKDLVCNPLSYVEFIASGFQKKLSVKKDQITKEERIATFWKYASVIGSVGFFISYVVRNKLISISVQQDDQDE